MSLPLRPPSQRKLRSAEAATWGQRPIPRARAERPRMTLRGWKPMRQGSLIGFAAISLPAGLETSRC
jgi:hypothetical protein